MSECEYFVKGAAFLRFRTFTLSPGSFRAALLTRRLTLVVSIYFVLFLAFFDSLS